MRMKNYGGRGGAGFGFRGSSPPWPYVGRGRGGLPRCGYFLGAPAAAVEKPLSAPTAPGQELDLLKNQAQALQEQLEQIEARLRDLETQEK